MREPRRALITGAGARVGQQIAIELARAGFEIAIHYRSSRAGAEETLAAVEAAGGAGWLVAADLCDARQRAQLCDAVEARWRGLELLVHNASLFHRDPIGAVRLERFRLMHQLHCEAPFFLTQRLLPLLRRGQPLREGNTSAANEQPLERALIVSLCDVAGEKPISGYSPYTSSKAALAGLTRAWAVELAPTVRAVGIAPGLNLWPEGFPEESKRALLSRVPLNRAGEPSEIARLVRFLALEGSYLNGVTIPVDGGFTLSY